jgi:hypothetical protein
VIALVGDRPTLGVGADEVKPLARRRLAAVSARARNGVRRVHRYGRPAPGDWFARRGFSGDRHHLLAPAALRVEDAVRRVRVPIAVYPTDEDTLHRVRPDGYIAFRSCPADLSALADYLDKAFGLAPADGPRA